MKIKILGSGCSKCGKTDKNAKEAVSQLGIDAEVVKVEDIVEIMQYGVMTSPTIVIDDNVKGTGKVFSVDEIKQFIQDEI